ncbi:MAG: PfaD family polyunsaturated fatty acid/polyketide biosynthesis protein [Pseudomonadota bacterium]
MNPATGGPARPQTRGRTFPTLSDEAVRAVLQVNRPVVLVVRGEEWVPAAEALFRSGPGRSGPGRGGPSGTNHAAAFVPACPLSDLGDASFTADYGLKYPYLVGSMANGISSVRMLRASADAGFLAFFGAGGLTPDAVEQALDKARDEVGDRPYGFNLIHSPNEPALEAAVVDLYLRQNIRLVEASAYMDLTLPLVRYRTAGIFETPDGRIETPNRIVAKASRAEVATRFFSPPPERFLQILRDRGELTETQVALAGRVPMAWDLTAEADSGGHTDNRPALALVPIMTALRDRLAERFKYDRPLRVGAGGGAASPASAAALFALGAAYVLTGSINQAAVEAGTSPAVREMLAKTGPADVTMAPAADMFELGVKVQVLKWGTMFPMRAARLFDLYTRHDSVDALPAAERENLEKNFFRAPLESIWDRTKAYFEARDRTQVQRAERDPKHRLALLFRWYLGQASSWANRGDPSRRIDYQVFCGPAMGAFNEWVKGSFLEQPENRTVAVMGLNILYGAAVLARADMLRRQGASLPAEVVSRRPLEPAEIEERLQ